MKLSRILIIIAIIAISSIVIYNKVIHPPLSSNGKKAQQDKISVEGVIAQTTSNEELISSSGTILAENEVEIRSEITGKVVQLNFKEGQTVRKGQLIAKIYDQDLLAQKSKIIAQLNLAKSNLNRIEPIYNVQGVSATEYDNAKNQISTLSADLQLLESNLSKTNILAPFSGKIGLRNISEGAIITNNTLITTLEDISSLKVETSVPERYSSAVKAGNYIDFVVNNQTDTFKATIFATDSKIDLTDRTIKLRAKVLNPKENLLPGQYVQVLVESAKRKSIFIPANSIISIGRIKKVMKSVNGIAFPQEVSMGVRNSEKVEITSGINQGDTIVTSGILFVKPKMHLIFKNFTNTNAKNN